MNTTPDIRRNVRSQARPEPAESMPALSQAMMVIAGGVSLFLLFAMLAALAYSFSYAGRIFPGVSAAGVDLSGLSSDRSYR